VATGNAVVYKTGSCPIHSSKRVPHQLYEEMARPMVQNAKRADMITPERV